MRQFIAPTEDIIKIERTQLALDAVPGTGVLLTVQNNSGFAINGYVAIGWEGAPNCELQQINAGITPGNTMEVGTLRLPHAAGEPVTLYRYNQRKFYGSILSTGPFVELTSYGSPKTIEVNDPQGTLFEYSGSEGYAYFKSTYYNSTTVEETAQTDSDAISSDQSGRYTTLYAIRKQAGLVNNPYITDEFVEKQRKRAESEIDGYINSQYLLPLTNSSGVQEVPWMIENCCVLLAGGYMDWQEFGAEGEGVKWLGQARGILTQLQKPGGMQLIGSDRQEMTRNGSESSGVQGYPDQVDNNNGPAQQFTMTQRF